ncbi:HAD family hydrolase [Anaerolineales bacterium HSG24]|nr:HAD family hydrolase [Anaerolineales bacterium HSG24]
MTTTYAGLPDTNVEFNMYAIFLDRDGVICENRADYVKSWAEFEFLPQAKDALVLLAELNLPIIVITNQSPIGRGILTPQDVEAIHDRMMSEITAHGGRIDRVIYCPSTPDEDLPCRKPKPGMLLDAAKEMELNLNESYMVGDAASDLLAGQRVGCRNFLVLTGRGHAQLSIAAQQVKGCFTVAPDLMTVTQEIIALESTRKTLAD